MLPSATRTLLPALLLGTPVLAQNHAPPPPGNYLASPEAHTTFSSTSTTAPPPELNGDWHVIVDPYSIGLYTFHQEIRKDGFFMNAPFVLTATRTTITSPKLPPSRFPATGTPNAPTSSITRASSGIRKIVEVTNCICS